MAHFAEIDKNNIVIRVLVVHNDDEHRGADFLANDLDLGGTWIQTSYNGNIRKNYAGVGYSYDATRDAFIAPEPEGHIGFDEETCKWIMPVIEIE
jgi:hypothetical protein